MKHEQKVKNCCIESLITKIFEIEKHKVESTEEIKVLKEEVNHVKEINCHYQNETKVINITVAKDKTKYTDIIKSKNAEIEKIKRTHDILKDLYEKQLNNYYNLLETKEMLEVSHKNHEIELNNKTLSCKKCDNCRTVLETNRRPKT